MLKDNSVQYICKSLSDKKDIDLYIYFLKNTNQLFYA